MFVLLCLIFALVTAYTIPHHTSRRRFIVGGVSTSILLKVPPPVFADSQTEDAVSTIRAARDALSSLLHNWDKSTIDCSVADVSRELLEQKNKEELLEKAKVFALFDKDGAVMSCKEDNKKVRNFVSKLKGLDKQFVAARDRVIDKDGDLDEYFSAVDDYSRRLSAANSFSYSAGSDLSSINGRKLDKSRDAGDQQIERGEGMKAAQDELSSALVDLDKICGML